MSGRPTRRGRSPVQRWGDVGKRTSYFVHTRTTPQLPFMVWYWGGA
jgi:hypothetical protein